MITRQMIRDAFEQRFGAYNSPLSDKEKTVKEVEQLLGKFSLENVLYTMTILQVALDTLANLIKDTIAENETQTNT